MLSSRQDLRSSISTSRDSPTKEIVTRIFKIYRIDPHPRRKILIIRGEVKISVTAANSATLIEEEIFEFRKLVKLDGITPESSVKTIVEELLENCPFVTENLIPEIHNSIEFLKLRNYDRNGIVIQGSKQGSSIEFPEYYDEEESIVTDVKMDSLDLYVELLYEDIGDKVRGAKAMVRLAQFPENLVSIFNHDTALNAVFRTIREEYPKSSDPRVNFSGKSIELVTSLLSLLLSFSHYSDFHESLTNSKICSLCFEIVEFEQRRFEKLTFDLNSKKELSESNEATQRTKAEYEKMLGKFNESVRRQDCLLAVAIEIIMNIGEDGAFLKEMHESGILRLLSGMLGRTNVRLLTTLLSFLLNLSVYKECLKVMIEIKILQQTMRLIDPQTPHQLLSKLFRLYYNLTFSGKQRVKMIKLGVLAKLTLFLDDAELGPILHHIMYNISIDKVLRSKFVPLDVIPKLVETLLHPCDNFSSSVLSALLLNLANSRRCAEIISGNGRLPHLLKFALLYQNPLVLKILRRISAHSGNLKEFFTELIPSIVSGVSENEKEEVVVELLGILVNYNLPNTDYCELFQGYPLFGYMKSILCREVPMPREDPGELRSIEEELLLQTVMLIGTCSSEPSCSDFIISQGVLEPLTQLITTHSLDTDIRLQVLYAVYRLSVHRKSLAYLLTESEIPNLIKGLLRSDCMELREMAQAIWLNFADHSPEWEEKVMKVLFIIQNSTWLHFIGEEIEGFDPDELNSMHAKYEEAKKLYASNENGDYEGECNAETEEKNMEEDVNKNREPERESFDESDAFENSEESSEDERDFYNEKSKNIPEGDDDDDDEPKSIFNQFEEQYNREMLRKIYKTQSTDDDLDESDSDKVTARGSSSKKAYKKRTRPSSAYNNRYKTYPVSPNNEPSSPKTDDGE